MQELQILPATNKEHKNIYLEVPIVGFRNGKSLKDYLVRAALPKTDNAGGFEPCGKVSCQVCDYIIRTNTFTAPGEVFKIQSGSLNCNSEKVLSLLRCKISDNTTYVGKAKTKFRLQFNNYNTALFEKENNQPQKRFHSHHDCHKVFLFISLFLDLFIFICLFIYLLIFYFNNNRT